MIEFERVGYTYPNSAAPTLHDLSLTIDEGSFVLVAGASGSGKSTFLRCLNGLVPHFYGGQFGGRALIDGRDTREHEPRDLAGIVGFVFQDPEAQMVVEVVEDELVFGMENLGLPTPIMRRRVEEVLDQLEVAHLRRRRVATLSGGERQRVAIAAVLAMQPRVLVLDEPTSQLDPHTAEEVLTALQKLNADLGLTIVLSEHRLERVVQYADHLIFFERAPDQPATIRIGSPREVLRNAPLAPPIVQLGRMLGWEPLPLTIKAGRQFVVAQGLDQPPEQTATTPRPDAASRATSLLSRWRVPSTATIPPSPAALEIDQLSVQINRHEILHRVSLTVDAGEIVTIMGRNGSGKTTLLRTIMGLVAPIQGTITSHGQALLTIPTEERARFVGYVPQDPRALLFQETVADELGWTLAQQQRSSKGVDVAERVRQTLDDFGLTHLAGQHPRDVSGGEQQRVAVATILVGDPPVLLLDEPTRGLDYRSKANLIALLERFKHRGHAIVLVTHDVEFVAACADRIVLLGNGEVVVAGPPRALLNESLIFSPQIGKLFRHRPWLTVAEAVAGLREG